MTIYVYKPKIQTNNVRSFQHRMPQSEAYWVKIILLNDQIKCLYMTEATKNTMNVKKEEKKIRNALK